MLATLAALVLFGAGSLAVVACSGADGDDTSETTVTNVAPESTVSRFSDPNLPVAAPIGRRFAIVLPADPANGWRWVAAPVDATCLAPLGSEFPDDPELLAQATTTTTAPAPPEEPPATVPGATITTAPTTTAAQAPPPTTVPGPLVQVISYAGKARCTAEITLGYERIGSAQEAPDPVEEITFTVVVGDPQLPAAESETTGPG